ncbi:Uncharacterised protein [Escherichia coli]|uniref:Uncharacterized protein n=1 Tax=Escherichia coli TaxID=562 RepID=A0A376TZW1_ECOLX|nr:Uncharacterised protein [Escherichia coli]
MTNGGADFITLPQEQLAVILRISGEYLFSWENLGLRPRRSSSPNARHHAMLKV